MEAHSLNADIGAVCDGEHLFQSWYNLLLIEVDELKAPKLLLGKVKSVLLVVNQSNLLGTTHSGTLCCQDADYIPQADMSATAQFC